MVSWDLTKDKRIEIERLLTGTRGSILRALRDHTGKSRQVSGREIGRAWGTCIYEEVLWGSKVKARFSQLKPKRAGFFFF